MLGVGNFDGVGLVDEGGVVVDDVWMVVDLVLVVMVEVICSRD